MENLRDRATLIDCLRGVAAISVLIYHAKYEFWIGGTDWLAALRAGHSTAFDLSAAVLLPFSLGWIGVPLFFVISGYCIQRSMAGLLKRFDRRKAVKLFMIRRIARIYPVYVLALIATLLMEIVYRKLVPGYEQQDVAFWTLIGHVFLLQGIAVPYFGGNVVLWTLSLEMHLYFVYAIAVLLRLDTRPRLLAASVFLLSVVGLILEARFGLFTGLSYSGAGLGPFWLPYWWTWFIGVYVGIWEDDRVMPLWPTNWVWIVATLLLAAIASLVAYPLAWLVCSFPFAAIVAKSISPQQWTPLAVWWLPLAYVGLFSYSLYALHSVTLKGLHLIGLGREGGISNVLIGSAVAVVTAYSLYRLVEKPAMDFARNRRTALPLR